MMTKKKCMDGRRNNQPPKEHQFKSGQSGNPKGRPKGSGQTGFYSREEILGLFAEEGIVEVNVRDGDKTVSICKINTIVKKLYQQAMGGCIKSMKIILEKNEKFGTSVSQLRESLSQENLKNNRRKLEAPSENAKKRIEIEERYIYAVIYKSCRPSYGEEVLPYQDWEPRSDSEWEILETKYRDRHKLWPD